eukprot:UC4_evm3s1335
MRYLPPTGLFLLFSPPCFSVFACLCTISHTNWIAPRCGVIVSAAPISRDYNEEESEEYESDEVENSLTTGETDIYKDNEDKWEEIVVKTVSHVEVVDFHTGPYVPETNPARRMLKPMGVETKPSRTASLSLGEKDQIRPQAMADRVQYAVHQSRHKNISNKISKEELRINANEKPISEMKQLYNAIVRSILNDSDL